MNSTIRRIDDLAIVDAAPHDYAPLLSGDRFDDLTCRRYTTGDAAIRDIDSTRATLWMVNLRLPDMTGVSFLQLLRQRGQRCPIFLIADQHSLEDELAARGAGASAYLCKPVNAAWLRLCRDAVSRAALRRGAPQSMS